MKTLPVSRLNKHARQQCFVHQIFFFPGSPEVTVDRDDVANEACWIPVP